MSVKGEEGPYLTIPPYGNPKNDVIGPAIFLLSRRLEILPEQFRRRVFHYSAPKQKSFIIDLTM